MELLTCYKCCWIEKKKEINHIIFFYLWGGNVCFSVAGFKPKERMTLMRVWFLEIGAGIKNRVELVWSFGDMKQIEKQEQYSGEK